MNEETRVAAARMATDLTIALLQDRSGHLNALRHEGKIPDRASPMAIYDEVFRHLLASLEPVAKE